MLFPLPRTARSVAVASLLVLLPAVIVFAGCSGANEGTSNSSGTTSSSTAAATSGASAGKAPSSLSIKAPASGALATEELQRIARDIRTLEKYPATKGARDGRRVLFQWLQGSPDISVSLCGKIVGPLLNADSERQPDILAQYLLSIAAKKIEAPDASTPEAKLSGVEGALNAYSVFLQQEGSGVQNAYMKDLRDMQKDGDLQDYILSEAEGC
jgi:hypothetical protein